MLKWRKIWQKRTTARIVVLGMICVVPSCSRGPNDAASLEKQIAGIGYVNRLVPLIRDLQTHRGFAAAFVDGDTSVVFNDVEEHIARNRTVLTYFDAQHPELTGAHERWMALNKQIVDRMESWRDQPRECFRQHTELIASGLALLSQVAEVSTLRADTTPDIRPLVDATTGAIPELAEAMGQTGDMVTSMAGQGAMVRDEQREEFRRTAENIRKLLDRIKTDYEQAYAADEHIRSRLEPQREHAAQTMTPVLDRLEHQVIASEYVKMTPDEWSPKAVAAIEAIHALDDASQAVLQGRLTARKSRS